MMPRSKWLFWIGVALSVGVPALLAIWLIWTGSPLGLPVLLISVSLVVAVRIAFTRRFTADLQPRPAPPPERELIDHARRPTRAIGLGILAITLLVVILVGLFGAVGSPDQRPPTPTPNLDNLTTANASPATARSGNLLTGFTLPIAAAIIGTIGLLVLMAVVRRIDRVILVPADDPLPDPPAPEPEPASGAAPALDWRELLADEDDEDDLSLWVDSLSRDDHPR